MQHIPGLDALTDRLDGAVGSERIEETVDEVQRILEEALSVRAVRLPSELRRPDPDHYARRLLHTSPEHDYQLLAMVWGPGQGTPIHDHAGMWCVEGVLEGKIEVQQFDLVGERGELCRFDPQELVLAGRGDAGALIPPYEYHTIANRSAERDAVTLHVYEGRMTTCTVFEPGAEIPDGWYRQRTKRLAVDAV